MGGLHVYKKIMVPVDLGHQDRLEKALTTAATLSAQYGAPVTFVGVTTAAPGSVAHNPAEYSGKLQTFAESQAQAHGLTADSRSYVSHDPSTDLNRTLLQAAADTGCDLIVMASHVPGFGDHIRASHGGNIAANAPVSVFVVR